MGALGAGPTDVHAAAHEDDTALVRLAQSSLAAFEPLYLRYRHRVIAYCYRRLGDRDEAEDAASTIFVAVLRGMSAFHDRGHEGAFRSWLFTIAHNEVAARHRTRARRADKPLEDASRVADPTRSPEDHAVVADDQRRLAELLSALPSREREVIELRTADLTTSEIAQVLGISEQNVRTAQARGIAKLRLAMNTSDVSTAGGGDV